MPPLTSHTHPQHTTTTRSHAPPITPNAQIPPELAALRADVEAYATRFPTVGFEKSAMRYKD